MRRNPLFTAALLLPLLGCRPPSIPPQPSAREYAVYNAWLGEISSTLSQPFAIDTQTLPLNQDDLQFQQCLPRRMQGLLTSAPIATLTSSSGNDWLTLPDGHPASLRSPSTPSDPSHPVESINLSRVAFTLSGYDAWLWVEHRTCGLNTAGCGEGHGALLHGHKSSGTWTFEETTCQTLIPLYPPQPRAPQADPTAPDLTQPDPLQPDLTEPTLPQLDDRT